MSLQSFLDSLRFERHLGDHPAFLEGSRNYTLEEENLIRNELIAIYSLSETARQMIDNYLSLGDKVIKFEYVDETNNAAGPPGRVIINPSFSENFRYFNPVGEWVQESLMGTLAHELVHSLKEIYDNWQTYLGEDNELNYDGETVEFANQIFVELGIEQQLSYRAAGPSSWPIELGRNYAPEIEIDRGYVGNSFEAADDGLNDLLIGVALSGNSELLGRDGDDYLYAVSTHAKYTLWGGEGNDFVFGGAGNDTLDGGEGFDIVFGAVGDDKFNHTVSDQIIDPIFGSITPSYQTSPSDIYFGGEGEDQFLVARPISLGGEFEESPETSSPFKNGIGIILDGGEDSDSLEFIGGNTTARAGDFNGQFTLAVSSPGAPTDLLFGVEKVKNLGSLDLSFSQTGSEITWEEDGETAHVAITGGETITFEGINNIIGTAGSDTIYGSEGKALSGWAGDDILNGGAGAAIYGGAGGDTINSGGGGSNLHGGSGANQISAQTGDIVSGSAGSSLTIDGVDISGNILFAYASLGREYSVTSEGVVLYDGWSRDPEAIAYREAMFAQNAVVFVNTDFSPLDGSGEVSQAAMSLVGKILLNPQIEHFDEETGGLKDDVELSTIYFQLGDFGLGTSGLTEDRKFDRDVELPNGTEIPLHELPLGNVVGTSYDFETHDAEETFEEWVGITEADLSVYYENFDGGEEGDENNNTYTGNEESNSYRAYAGDDTVFGGGGNDFVFGGAGDDRIVGDAGNDTLFGGDGRDNIQGGAGDDTLAAGADSSYHGGGQYLRGRDGDDTYLITEDDFFTYILDETETSGTADHVVFQDHNFEDLTDIQIVEGDNFDTLRLNFINAEGLDAKLWIRNHQNIESFEFSNGEILTEIAPIVEIVDETFTGSEGDDVFDAGIGQDTMYGNGGADTLSGGDDDDLLFGGSGADNLKGSAGNDTLYGDEGDDRMLGGNGNDTLYGGDGRDNIQGGAGDDTLAAGADSSYHGGGQYLRGREGNDTYLITEDDFFTYILDETETSGTADQIIFQDYNFEDLTNIQFVEGSSHDTLRLNFENAEGLNAKLWVRDYQHIESFVFADGAIYDSDVLLA